MIDAPKTAEEAMALPETSAFSRDYPYLGASKISGDSIFMFTDADGYAKRIECRRKTIDGPDIWLKMKINL